MVLTLYGYTRSTCTQRVAMTLLEKGVPFKFVLVDLLKGEQKAPAYMEKQPFGQVPYIDDDGFILYESRPIARYIAEKYAGQGEPLIPTELKAKALFEQAFSIENFNYNPIASKAVFDKLVKPQLTGIPPDQTQFDTLMTELGTKLNVYDQILAKQKYLAGDQVTLADLSHLPYAELLHGKAGTKVFEERPNVLRWLNELRARPSWQAVKDGVVAGTA
ncbi:hypothetical protein MD484_g8657, partial [Candolleomyces efflorescens]